MMLIKKLKKEDKAADAAKAAREKAAADEVAKAKVAGPGLLEIFFLS